MDELDELESGPLFEVDVLGSPDVPGSELVSVDGEGSSDAVASPAPLTCGTTTSDDDPDPEASVLAPVGFDELTTGVEDVEVLVRCNAARTEDGDSGAGR